MSKKIMEDMQSVGIRTEKRLPSVTKPDTVFKRAPSERIPQTPQIRKQTKMKGKQRTLTIFFIIAILVGIYTLSNFYTSAHITINAKTEAHDLSHTEFTALNSINSKIHFELMIVKDDIVRDAILTNTSNISEKAHGTMTLYNTFSSKPVPIAIHTMVSDPAGKTYLTDQAVTIPPFTMNGAVVAPGEVEVPITSFLTGDTYNGLPTDFTINAYKGTTKATKIYGKSVTPLEGGADGLVYVMSPEDKGKLEGYADSTLKSELIRKANAEIPPGYILYNTALAYSYQIDENAISKLPNTKINIHGLISAIILSKQDLSNALIMNSIPTISPSEMKEIEITDIDKLAFSFTDPAQAITKDLTTVAFNLSGSIHLVWHPDTSMLLSKIAGASKASIDGILRMDPGITDAHVSIFPIWQWHIPADSNKIHIKVL